MKQASAYTTMARMNGRYRLAARRTLLVLAIGLASLGVVPVGADPGAAPAAGQDFAEAQVVVQRGHRAWVYSVAASPDGELYASASRDRTLKLWNRSGVLVRTFSGHAAGATVVIFSPDGKLLASGDEVGTIRIWETATGRLVTELAKGHTTEIAALAFGPGDWGLLSSSIKGTNVKSEASAVRWNLAGTSPLWSVHFETDTYACAVSPKGEAVVSSNGALSFFSADGTAHGSSKPGHAFDSLAYDAAGRLFGAGNGGASRLSPRGAILASYPAKPREKDKYVASAIDPRAGLWVELRDKGYSAFPPILVVHSLSGGQDKEFPFTFPNRGNAMAAAIAPDGSSAIAGFEQNGYPDSPCAVVIDLDAERLVHLASATDWPLAVGADPAGGGFRVFHQRGLLSTWSADLDPVSMTRVVKDFDFDFFTGASFSPTGRKLALGRLGYVGVLSPDGLTLEKETDGKASQYIGVTDDGGYVLFHDDNAVRCLARDKSDSHTGALFAEMRRFSIAAAFSPDAEWIAAGFHDLYLLPAKNAKAGYKVYGDKPIVPSPPKTDLVDSQLWIQSLAFDSKGERIAYGRHNGETAIVDRSGHELARLPRHAGEIVSLAFSPDGEILYSASEDGTVRITRLSTGNFASLVMDGEEWCLYTDDGYFDASSGGGRLIGISIGGEAFGADQFAARNNRPDIVLERLGLGSPALLAHYREQYSKRLARMGLDEASLASLPLLAPQARIESAHGDGGTLELEVSFASRGGDLRSCNAWINDVPILGEVGRSISGREARETLTVELQPGLNKIEVGCRASDGLDSFRAMTRRTYEGGSKPSLYFLAFGVSKYEDPSIRLGYAAKDAKDLLALFRRMEGKGFEKVVAKAWADAEVTPQAIEGAKALLAGAKPADALVLFVAGHGAYAEDDRYYYLPYGAKVADLPGSSVDFESFERLLREAAPRSRLFLMDTCESGERDGSAEAAAAAAKGASSRSIKPAASRAISIRAAVAPAAFRKNRYIYNDLLRRSGAIVFSSSRGGEASWEFKDLQNGAFTAAIKKCLTDPEADRNKDGAVSVDELRSYVGAAVPAMIRARLGLDIQHPTVDRDNLYQKFAFPLLK